MRTKDTKNEDKKILKMRTKDTKNEDKNLITKKKISMYHIMEEV